MKTGVLSIMLVGFLGAAFTTNGHVIDGAQNILNAVPFPHLAGDVALSLIERDHNCGIPKSSGFVMMYC